MLVGTTLMRALLSAGAVMTVGVCYAGAKHWASTVMAAGTSSVMNTSPKATSPTSSILGGATPMIRATEVSKSEEIVPPTQIGMNLGTPNYWSSEWTFDDIIQSTAAIVFMTPDCRWLPLVDQIKLDTDGHPVSVPVGTRLNVVVQLGSPRIPMGTYDCTISKGWSIRPFGAWQMEGSGTKFKMKVINQPNKAIVLLLTATVPNADLKELSCKTTDGSGRRFNPTFLADNKPFGVLRFMDWMRTNNAAPRSWSARPTPAAFSQAGKQGVAIEHIVALANKLNADPWINLPFDADPDYYRQMAIYVRDNLAKDRRVYVELSNEVWNTLFQQAKDSETRGIAAYPGIPRSQANDYYYADRVRAAMAIWSEVFAGQHKRLVRVLASQAVNPRRAEQALSHLDTWRSVDALATAPYFGTDGANISAPPGQARINEIFARGPSIVDEAIRYARATKTVANKYGLRYVAYEGGPSFLSYRSDIRDDMFAVNADPRMYDLYALFLRRWKAEIGDLFVTYNSVSTPSVGGNWGHRIYTGQPLADAPKARAITEAASVR